MAFPYNFNVYSPQIQQPGYQPVYQANFQQPQTIQTSMLWVSSIDEVKAYPTAPNTVLPFYDNDGHTEYWKQTDASGRAFIRVFDRIDRSEAQGEQKPQAEPATKEDIAAIVASISELQEIIKGGAEHD